MNNVKKERAILNFIKYGPIVLVLILSFVITNIALEDKKENFKKDIKYLEQTFLDSNKKRIREEVEEVYNYIQSEKEKSEKLLKETIKSRVYEAHKIATNIYQNETKLDKEHNHSDKYVLYSIKNALGGILYNKGRGYIFMDDEKGTKLLQPFNEELEGKNLLEFEDAKGYKFVHKIVKTIKNKTEAYDTYYWYKSGNKEKTYKKMSFYKYFEPLNTVIGTGEYIQDFENELKEKVLKRINEIRYGEAGYIFVYDLEGNCLSHYKKNLLGKNRINYQDKEGRYLVKEIVEFGKQNTEGYMSYDSSVKPLDEIATNSKISYLKSFSDWNWVIGTGFYTDTLVWEIQNKKKYLEESNQKSVEKIIYSSSIITFIFILISFYISRHLRISFDAYKESLNKEINKTVEKDQQLIQQSKMAIMGEMIANITHQWKQPLNLITMSNSIIQFNNEVQSIEEIVFATKKIDNAVNHLSTTMDDFRDFFRPNKKKEHFKVRITIEKTCNLIDSQFKHNNINLQKDIKDISVYTFQNELVQVLLNIFKNAIDEFEKQTIEKRFIFAAVDEDEENIIIKIKDNAGGVPENIIDKVFDSYFTTKADDKGTGIGLYMSKQIIENMKGKIEVQNKEYIYEETKYTGAEFTITIPKEGK